MRISDWSSDVCSSDLQGTLSRDSPVGGRGTGTTACHSFLHHTSHRDRVPGCPSDCCLHAIEQIGRASCRERVCQYRVDLGGRRIIKQKTITNTRNTTITITKTTSIT